MNSNEYFMLSAILAQTFLIKTFDEISICFGILSMGIFMAKLFVSSLIKVNFL